jgi:hypothetical protein
VTIQSRIRPFSGNDIPHAAPRIKHITWKAGDQMNVNVRDSLATCFADVDAHVEAAGMMFVSQSTSHSQQNPKDGP